MPYRSSESVRRVVRVQKSKGGTDYMYRTVGVRCRKIIPSKQMKNITIYRYAGRAAELDLETVRSVLGPRTSVEVKQST